MKVRLYIFFISILILLNSGSLNAVCRYGQSDFSEASNYVVIGAFLIHKNAIQFTEHVRNKCHLDAKFELNQNRNLYYVYVLDTDDRVQAINEAMRLRTEAEFTGAWVYHGTFDKVDTQIGDQESILGIDINPVTEQHIIDVTSDDRPDPQNNATLHANELRTDQAVDGKNFFFKIFNETSNFLVEGDVDVIDIRRLRKMASYKGNTVVRVSAPMNKQDSITLVCEVFGYRKVQYHIPYNDPEDPTITRDEQGTIIIPFELKRLRKGDIAVMYNVYFFIDADVMRPESRFEINSLLEMLKENEKYRIKIHGHTNGGANGKIISMNKNSKSFFALSDAREGIGSAKQLSEKRAETIRNYLVSNGIDPERMQIKAWGGKRPLQDKHSARAQENVRVEIEILED